MVGLFAPKASRRTTQTLATKFRHLGALGLFFLAILDSSPIPTFGGPDILTAVLAARHREPWYEYAIVATAGSVIGAYLTFRLARKAGAAYLDNKFKKGKVSAILKLFEKRSVGALFASTAIPFPFPTSMLFAAAGVSNQRTGKFLTIVALGRGARYSAIAIVADLYGRRFIRGLSHPTQHWGWLVVFTVLIVALIVGGILANRQLVTASPE